MNLGDINKQLSAVNPGYSARFVPAGDETVDDAINILLHGTETRWAIQIGADYVGINEYGFENGELVSSTDHGHYANLKRAVVGLCGLLERETQT